eukprot:scaffold68651_cov18-Tisochrysis_lutea.AAC.1
MLKHALHGSHSCAQDDEIGLEGGEEDDEEGEEEGEEDEEDDMSEEERRMRSDPYGEVQIQNDQWDRHPHTPPSRKHWRDFFLCGGELSVCCVEHACCSRQERAKSWFEAAQVLPPMLVGYECLSMPAYCCN